MEFRIIKYRMRRHLSFGIVLFICVLHASMTAVNPDYTFSDYVRQFNKDYDAQEYPKREIIFNTNFQRLKAKMSEQGASYTVQVNKFTDWSQEQKSSYSKYKPSSSKLKYSPAPSLRLGAGAQLTPVDYRALGKVTPVKDQGQCGSCWAFSTTGLYESLFLIQQNKLMQLSQQFTLDCSGGGTCDGGVPNDALNAITKTGLPLESNFAYTASYTSANSKCANSALNKLAGSIVSINHYNSLTDGQVQQLLIDNGPLAVGVSAGNSAFMDYSSGIFSGCPGGASVDHAVLLVGFTAEGHWIIKNSWGADWGDLGYITIDKNNDCGLKTFVDAVVVQKSSINNATNTTGTNTTNTTNTTDTTVNYTVTLTDSFGDGWNGNVLAVSQSGSIVAIFGSKFTSGSIYGPVLLPMKKGVQTSIVVYTYSLYTNQIGFKIMDDKGIVIYSRTPASYSSTFIFTVFCPYCAVSSSANIYISLSDSYGDGWNGNQIAVKRNSTYYTFGQSFTSGHEYPNTIKINLKTGVSYDLVPYVLGNDRNQVGFVVRNEYGIKLVQRIPGKAYFATDILSTFCLQCTNALHVNEAKITDEQQTQYTAKQQLISASSPSTKQPVEGTNETVQNPDSSNKAISIIVILSVILVFIVFLWGVTMIALYRMWKKVKYSEQNEDNKSTSIHFTLNQNKSTMKTEIDKTIKQESN